MDASLPEREARAPEPEPEAAGEPEPLSPSSPGESVVGARQAGVSHLCCPAPPHVLSWAAHVELAGVRGPAAGQLRARALTPGGLEGRGQETCTPQHEEGLGSPAPSDRGADKGLNGEGLAHTWTGSPRPLSDPEKAMPSPSLFTLCGMGQRGLGAHSLIALQGILVQHLTPFYRCGNEAQRG